MLNIYFLVDLDFCEAKFSCRDVGLALPEVVAPLLVLVGSLEDVDATGSLFLCEGRVGQKCGPLPLLA